MELYMIDSRIIAGDVAKGSPAEEAGVKEGDEVLAVNANFNQNLNQYKIALQQPGEKVKLVLRRNGELVLVQFKIASIY
jgi:predicted metalloprotease with PDZ domain